MAEGLVAGAARLPVIPELSEFGNLLLKGLDNIGGVAEQGGKKVGSAFSKGFAAIGATAITVGGFAIAAAEDVDKGLHIIEAQTGTTGKALEGLRISMEKVATTAFGATFADSGAALSSLYQSTGLTGGALQKLAIQFLDFNNLAGVTPITIDALTGVMKAFNIPATEMSQRFDDLFKIAQQTGVPVASLLATLGGTGGPILRQFGLGLDQAAVFIANLTKAGIPANQSISGLRKAFAGLGKGDEDPATALREIVNQITGLVKAGDLAGARQLSVQLFGAKGAGLIDAIQSGKLSLDAFNQSLDLTGKGIIPTAEKTATLHDQFDRFKNQLSVSLAPLGEKLLGSLTKVFKELQPAIVTVADALGHVSPNIIAFAAALGGIGFAVAKIAPGIATLINVFKGVGTAFQALSAIFAANPWVLIIAAVVVLVIVVVKNWDTIKAFLIRTWNQIFNGAKIIWGAIERFFKRFWPIILVVMTGGLAAIVLVIVKNWNTITAATATAWNAIVNVVKALVGILVQSIVTPVNFVLGFWTGAWNTAITVFNWLRDAVSSGVDWIIAKLEHLADWVGKNAHRILGPLGDVLSAGGKLLSGDFGGAASAIGLASGGTRGPGWVGLVGEDGPELAHALPGGGIAVSNASDTRVALSGVGGGGGATFNAPLVQVQTMVVRNESDIEAVSRGLHARTVQTLRSKGVLTR